VPGALKLTEKRRVNMPAHFLDLWKSRALFRRAVQGVGMALLVLFLLEFSA